MIKVGFIDYYLDEWHANTAPKHLEEQSNGEVKVCFAYGEIPSPKGVTSEQWCEKMGVEQCATIDEVIEKSDVIIVLAPDNCERKEDLCREALASGKPCFVDKPFGTDLASAKRMFDIAEKSGTPCYTCSSLRYAQEYCTVDREAIKSLVAMCPQNSYDNYILHALEPAMMLMGEPAKRVSAVSTEDAFYSVTIEMQSGRHIVISSFNYDSPYMMNISIPTSNKLIDCSYDFWIYHYKAMVEFFKTGVEPVSHKETLMIAAAREAGKKSLAANGEWIAVEQ